jgi:hypothetical protein
MFYREHGVISRRSFAVKSGDVNPDVSWSSADRDGRYSSCLAMPQVQNPPYDPQKARLPLRLMLLASAGVQ